VRQRLLHKQTHFPAPPQPEFPLPRLLPAPLPLLACRELLATVQGLEAHMGDLQDCEFTVQDGQLFMLQTRNGKRTGHAALRIAVDMQREV
jgi:pyruvate,orthophosphate dikinase